MNIEFYNCPEPLHLDPKILPKDKAEFLTYRPDFTAMQVVANKYAEYKNILVVGHGGSVSSFYGLYNALRRHVNEREAKNAFFLSTVDPDYIMDLEAELNPADTLVVAISKSGEDTTQLEALTQFWDFPILVVTEKDTPLYHIAQKKKLDIVLHSAIGGRFTAFTETALLPALLCGLDVQTIFRGGREVHALYETNNLAWKAANVVWQLEQNGVVDVLGFVYSHFLQYLSPLVVQLCHESFGKSGLGQTYSFSEGPEAQHHTLQRFLGGRKNVLGWFVGLTAGGNSAKTNYSPEIHSVVFHNQPLFNLNNLPLEQSMQFERTGMVEDAKLKNMPICSMALTACSSLDVGKYIGFWQMFAVYSSILRGLNPFDQPEVESGKLISFNKRLAYKGLL